MSLLNLRSSSRVTHYTPWHWKYVGYATIVFISSLLAGLVTDYVQGFVSLTKYARLTNVTGTSIPPTSTIGYFLHNGSIVLSSWIGGFTVFAPIYVLWQNGMNISNFVYGALFASPSLHQTVFLLVFLIPHGIFEIPGVLIGIGASLYIGHQTFEKIVNGQPIRFIRILEQTVKPIIASLILLGIAAVIEANLSVQIATAVANMVT